MDKMKFFQETKENALQRGRLEGELKRYLKDNSFNIPKTEIEGVIISLMRVSHPQSYGGIIEKILRNSFKLKRTSDGNGDIETSHGKKIEVKSGYIRDGIFRAVQIRPHEKNDFYLFIVISKEKETVRCFYIPAREIEKRSVNKAHGKSIHETTEYTINVNVEEKWFLKFEVPLDDLSKTI